MKKLKILENDPYLEPQKEGIEYRVRHWMETEKRLVKDGTLSDFANGHKYFGLHKTNSDWIIREWAPNAISIFMMGDFSNWHQVADFELKKIDDSGIWELKLPLKFINHLDKYRLKIYWNGGEGERIPTYANYVTQDEKTHGFNACVWSPEKPYIMKNDSPSFKEAPVIYESHIGMAQNDAKVSSYREFKDNILQKIVDSNYNTVQIMAIQEHPYYGSFGYQVSNFFASSSRFGTPDELKELIDTAHALGLKVIMDIVHSHAVKNEVEGLGCFDGTNHQFFHAGDKGDHSAWGTKCFDYGKDEVIHFLLSNCKYWMEEFKFDGFRFDGVTSMLYHHRGLGKSFGGYEDYFNHEVDFDAVTYLTLANRLIHQLNPNAISIAEDVSGMPGIGVPAVDGGLDFDYRLAMGIPDFWIKTLKECSDYDWNVDLIWGTLKDVRSDESSIFYAESHDQALVGDKTLIFWLNDKNMYTNMSVFNRNMEVDRGIALHKMIRLITISCGRGGYLNFMGNEFGHPEWIDFPREGNNWSYHYARRQWNLKDDESLCYKFLARFDKDMIDLIRTYQILNLEQPELLYSHVDNNILIFKRGKFIFIFNFHPEKSFSDFRFSVSFKGDYVQLLSTDTLSFGGFGNIEESQVLSTKSDDSGDYLMAYLPSRTAQVFKLI